MFFQNPNKNEKKEGETLLISSEPRKDNRIRKLGDSLPCQDIIKANRGHSRGTISENYNVSETVEQPHDEHFLRDHVLWLLIRYMYGKWFVS